MNINIPACIEMEDPRAFMQIRPIHEFRHTPLVPIDEGAMRRHKEMLERHHRKGFVFEVSRESILNYLLVAAAGLVLLYLVRNILKREEENIMWAERRKARRNDPENQLPARPAKK
jgi:hypothetical protein